MSSGVVGVITGTNDATTVGCVTEWTMQDAIRTALGLTADEARTIQCHCTQRSMRAGDVIIPIDGVPSFLAIVISGRVSLITLNGSEIQLGPGTVLGEVAFVSQEGRTAEVVARTEGEIVVLTYDAGARGKVGCPGSARP